MPRAAEHLTQTRHCFVPRGQSEQASSREAKRLNAAQKEAGEREVLGARDRSVAACHDQPHRRHLVGS
eukprot:6179102-Pleurochrysis_carterae.AAC.1